MYATTHYICTCTHIPPLLMQSTAIIVGGSGALGRAFISHLNTLNYVIFKFQCFLFNKLYLFSNYIKLSL